MGWSDERIAPITWSMRLLPLLLAVAALAGCAGGPEATQAYDLLERAQAAQTQVSSVSYEAKASFSVRGQRFGYAFKGAALLKGASAGDQWIEMKSEDARIAMTLIRHGSRMTVRSMGQTQELPLPEEFKTSRAVWGSFDSLDLTSCVKEVDVAEGRSLNGEPATRIAGEIDALCAFEAVSAISGLGQNAGSMADLEQLRDHVGHARVTLFVSDRTHLLVGGLITLEIDVDGNKLSFDVSYRLTSINRPVRFPA